MRRIEPEFRAAVVKPGNPSLPQPHAADPLAGRFELPRDTRALTRGIRGKLRWAQTRLGRNVRPDPAFDRLDLSERARRARGGASPAGDPDLAAAEETLDRLLAELGRRNLGGHPRAQALQALKGRLARERRAAPWQPGPGAGATGETATWWESLGSLWDSLLALVQRPDERAAHRLAILAESRRRLAAGDRRGATRRLERLVVRDQDDAEAHARLGRLQMDVAAYDLADPHVRHAARLRPRDAAAHIALGELHYHAGDSREALAAFGQALRLKPDHSDANAWLGILAHEGERPVEALRFLERAISFDPNHAVARYYLAQVSLSQGDSLRARYQLDMVRRLEPGADLTRFGATDPPALPARTGAAPFSGWVVPRAGRLAGRPTP